MSQRAIDRSIEWGEWWNEHIAESGDVMKRIARLEKAVSGLYDLLSFVLEDVHDLEGRPKEALGPRLYTPAGMFLTRPR